MKKAGPIWFGLSSFSKTIIFERGQRMFTAVTHAIVRFGGRALLLGKKYLPEILTYSGIAGFIGTVFCACKATTRAEEIMAEEEERMARHEKYAANPNVEYTTEQKEKDDQTVRNQTRWKLIRAYLPTATLLIASVMLVLAGHHIMHVRSAATAAAYKTMETAYNAYRNRVRERFGPEVDQEIVHGKKASEGPLNGKEGHSEKGAIMAENDDEVFVASPYAVWFGPETSTLWKPDIETNFFTLRRVLREMNDNLHFRGHVFLNEVYEALGMKFGPDNTPYKSFGQLVGWVETKDGSTDNCIDFGLDDWNNVSARLFRQSKCNRVLLDFNTDGIIYDQI